MNLRSGIGWKFPPLGGGEGQGFEHAGMAHFQGNLLGSLAREVIQNSLDAQLDDTKPVDVTFELKNIDLHQHLDGDDLQRHILACGEAATGEKARRFFAEAASRLDAKSIPFLRISDGNTTGLGEKQWRALVKMQGDSAKRDVRSGGSFGIGKNAPFAVSTLRTVCYWTCSTNGHEGVEKFQAKAILMSHDWSVNGNVEVTQGAGYFGFVDACRELRQPRIPPVFRRVGRRLEPVGGTTVWIAGFRADGEWQREIARSVIANYFYAIDHGRLDVLIEPDESSEDDPTASLARGSLKSAFDYLTSRTDSDRELEEAYTFWRVQRKNEPTFEEDLGDLGLVRLWIEVGEDPPRKVALIRGTGMLITDNQRGLRQFRDLRDFAAVCVFESDEANELLRQMENPAHDQFEPERLPEQHRRQGRLALERVVKWIREKLRAVAAPPPAEGAVDLGELAHFLRDLDAPGPLARSERGDRPEKAFGTPGAISPKRPRGRVRPGRLETEGEGGDGDGSGSVGGGPIGEGGGGTGGGRGGSGDGGQTGGTGSRGGGAGRGLIPIRDVRVLPVPDNEARVRVAFTPVTSGRARLSLEAAGDSTALPLPGIRLLDESDQDIPDTGVQLKANVRFSMMASANLPLAGVALRVTAAENEDS